MTSSLALFDAPQQETGIPVYYQDDLDWDALLADILGESDGALIDQRIHRRLRAILNEARDILVDTLRTYVPVVSGKLLRSMVVRWTAARELTIDFRVVYANRVNRTSKRNRRWAQRGTRAGIRDANRFLRRRLAFRIITFDGRRFTVRRYFNGRLRIRIPLTERPG